MQRTCSFCLKPLDSKDVTAWAAAVLPARYLVCVDHLKQAREALRADISAQRGN